MIAAAATVMSATATTTAVETATSTAASVEAATSPTAMTATTMLRKGSRRAKQRQRCEYCENNL